ncbi:MAG: hypothetical protein WEB58_20430 [Planctomycetaceae bacterium]
METAYSGDDGAPVGARGSRHGANGAESLALVDDDLRFLIDGFPRLSVAARREILDIARAELGEG